MIFQGPTAAMEGSTQGKRRGKTSVASAHGVFHINIFTVVYIASLVSTRAALRGVASPDSAHSGTICSQQPEGLAQQRRRLEGPQVLLKNPHHPHARRGLL